MQTRQTGNSFPSPKNYRDFRETGPWFGGAGENGGKVRRLLTFYEEEMARNGKYNSKGDNC